VLVIRDAQMDALGRAALRAFEDEMVAHLGNFSPPLAKAVGEEQLRTAIRLGTERAASHGLDQRGPVRLYLELMLLFGSYFDTDPQYTWAATLLGNRDAQITRAERLYERALDYRGKVAGPDDTYTLRALHELRTITRQLPTFSSIGFVGEMFHQIERIYPEKAASLDRPELEALIQEGINQAHTAGFSPGRQTALVIVLMLCFGHGCFQDPLYPWIARTLEDTVIVDAPARAERLMRRAVTWLDRVLANYDQVAGP
jgi:hypothetical protein